MIATTAISKVKRNSSEPLRDQILHRCRMMLMCGHVLPGQKLPLRPLASEFDTSLMPVRDALNRLVADGALELSANRRIRVPHMTDQRLIELHEIRRSLEGLAAECAVENLTGSAIRRLEEIILEMRQALEKNDFDDYIRAHYSFHFTIYGAARRPTLLDFIDMLWLQVGPWFRQGIERANRLAGNPNACHEKIVAALRARDVKATRAGIELDISSGIESLRNGVWP